ncbi:hydrogen peroxide-inducible genes activator [Candidatus Thiothrix anitrata]|uniref:LysR family transcriptional regulator n=1 Tax=Candidatus Thiothrix anitrata TaxID=2823902 RepID=A0ABX7WYV0_9GAMM|nr:hydrogen peroxide-inducible genes activator [Candidatus Thiothrix anitrata]QTR48576.1 LysR family transcriptional regulator [Candidatus Thiothrix anitrata]
MNLPTVKQLRYFVALESTEHFGKAAEACFVSQSAFSTAIRELETTLEVQLVDRTNKNVTVTHIGRQIASEARRCLRDMENLVELARSNQLPLTGELRVGIIPTIAPFLLPQVLPPLRQKFQQLRLFLTEDITQRVHEKLMNGELDLIVIALPYALRNVEVHSLFQDRFLLACREDTQHTRPRRYIFDELNPESILLLEDGHCLRDHALSACHLQDMDKVSRFTASSLLTLVQMLDSDLGISYLPEMVQGSSLLSGTNVKLWPLPDANYREIGLAWRRGSAREAEFVQLGKFIRHIWETQTVLRSGGT